MAIDIGGPIGGYLARQGGWVIGRWYDGNRQCGYIE